MDLNLILDQSDLVNDVKDIPEIFCSKQDCFQMNVSEEFLKFLASFPFHPFQWNLVLNHHSLDTPSNNWALVLFLTLLKKYIFL